MRRFLLIMACCIGSFTGQAQSITLETALLLAVRNNPVVKVSTLETSRQKALTRSSADIPKMDVSLMYGQFNSIQRKDNNISVSQRIPFPVIWSRQRKLNHELVIASGINERVTENELKYEVRKIFNRLLYLQSVHQMLNLQDSLMRDMARAVDIQYKTGESNLLAKTSADTRLLEITNQLKRNEADRKIYLDRLRFLCREDFSGVQGKLDEAVSLILLDSTNIANNPSIALTAHQVAVAERTKKLESARAMPDITIGYFTQTLIGLQNINGTDQYFGSDRRFHGFQVGLSIPLWYAPFNARTKAAAISRDVAKAQYQVRTLNLTQQYSQAEQELIKNTNSLRFFRESALKTATLLQRQSIIAFKNGEIDYKSHLLNIQQVLNIEMEYLTTLVQYNDNVITIYYLTGKDQK